jgi:hypothetical protein
MLLGKLIRLARTTRDIGPMKLGVRSILRNCECGLESCGATVDSGAFKDRRLVES